MFFWFYQQSSPRAATEAYSDALVQSYMWIMTPAIVLLLITVQFYCSYYISVKVNVFGIHDVYFAKTEDIE